MLQSEEARGARLAFASSPQGDDPVDAGAVPADRHGAGHQGSRQSRKVALVDELPLRRASTLHLLELHLQEPAVGLAGAAELVARARPLRNRLSCILLAVGGRSLDDATASHELRLIRDAFPAVPLAVLSDLETIHEVAAAFRLGARGLIPASLDPKVAVEALRLVQAGGSFFPAGALIGSRHRIARPQPVAMLRPDIGRERWPPRQLAVLRLLAQGRANKEIARTLGMEESTVKVHVWHIMRKLAAANRTEAALRAAELGIIGQDEPCEAERKPASARSMVA